MKWQAVLYFFSFGSLVASIVAGVFTPFCRRRPEAQRNARGSTEGPARRSTAGSEQERISGAMRHWTAVRADADLSYTPPPPQPAPAAKPEAPPATAQAVLMREAKAAPPPVEEPRQEPKEDSGTVAEPNPFLNRAFSGAPNFYEILQISPRADLDTIHRVYRIMAARFHPDNPVSGDHERFLKLCEAYDVLSRPERRTQYDAALRAQEARPIPIFETRLFVDGLDGELNRRFGILALLYQRRRLNQGTMGISTLDLERRMALPREHLEFTLWYLRNKGYVQILDENSDYAVTTMGVDYVEANSAQNPILQELLTAGDEVRKPAPATRQKPGRHKGESRRARRERDRECQPAWG